MSKNIDYPDYLYPGKAGYYENEKAVNEWVTDVRATFDSLRSGKPTELWMDWIASDCNGRIAVMDAEFEGYVPLKLLEYEDVYIGAWIEMIGLIWKHGPHEAVLGDGHRCSMAGFFYYKVDSLSDGKAYKREFKPKVPVDLGSLSIACPNIKKQADVLKISKVDFGSIMHRKLRPEEYFDCTVYRRPTV